MAYQETTSTSYGSRVGNSIKNILVGIILFIGSTVLLWWNEGRTVKTSDANEAAYEETIPVSDISVLNSQLNGKMIHANGEAITHDSLIDTQFGIGTTATKLIREVEYYQWEEKSSTKTEDKFGGREEKTTTYTYDKKWVSAPINSSNFKDPSYTNKNFVVSTVESEIFTASDVDFGAYKLPPFLISQISGEQDFYFTLPADIKKSLNNQVKNALQLKGSIAEAALQPNAEYVHVNGNTIYLGANPDVPHIGDVRITFSKVLPSNTVTVWAKVVNNTFEQFTCKNGYTVSTLNMGTQSLDETFQNEQEANSTLAWILRLVGLVLVYIALRLIFELLTTILKVVPFIANIADFGSTIVCGIVGLAWTLIVIALAWIFYRPILAILILVAVAALIVLFVKKAKAKKANLSQNE